MKRLFLSLVLSMLMMPIMAQQVDSAALIVGRYERMLNMDMIPRDQMVVVKTTSVNRDNPKDTIFVRRWQAFPNKIRVEVRYKGHLIDGFYTDGKDQFMVFDTIRDIWRTSTEGYFYDNTVAYDVRGIFHNWKSKGISLTYKGEKMAQGKPIYHIQVDAPNSFRRDYFFEKESGLLFLYKDLDTFVTDSVRPEYKTDWHFYHEFQMVGPCMFPKVESYQNQMQVHILRSEVEFLPFDEKVFKKERVKWE